MHNTTASVGQTFLSAAADKNVCPTPKRNLRGKLILVVSCLAALATGWWLAGGGQQHDDRETLPPLPAHSGRAGSAVMVTLAPVTFRTVQRGIEALGTLHGFEEIMLSSKVEGFIRRIHHDVADRVQPGELLLEIETTRSELALDEAERALAVELAKLGLEKLPDVRFDLTAVPTVVLAKARLENMHSRLERQRGLSATRAISIAELETATSEHRTAHAEYNNQLLQAKTVLATVRMKQSAVAVAQQNVNDAQICVPTPLLAAPGAEEGFTYAITRRTVAEGALVRPGTEIYKLIVDHTLKLRVPIPERYSGDVRLGQKADVHTAAFASAYAGVVTRINPAVEPSTRTFEVEIQIPNPGGDLRPGSFAKAVIKTRVDADAATVPLAAVSNFAGVTKIFLADNGSAKLVPVTLGVQTNDWVEIASPRLTHGDQVVTSGQTVLADATPIAVRDPATATAQQAAPGKVGAP